MAGKAVPVDMATWATDSSCHLTSVGRALRPSSQPISGRDRRRLGKQRQQRLIANLRQHNLFLCNVIAELQQATEYEREVYTKQINQLKQVIVDLQEEWDTDTVSHPPGFFSLFQSTTSDVATQTASEGSHLNDDSVNAKSTSFFTIGADGLPTPTTSQAFIAEAFEATANHAPAGDPAMVSSSSQLSCHPTQCGLLPRSSDFNSHHLANGAFDNHPLATAGGQLDRDPTLTQCGPHDAAAIPHSVELGFSEPLEGLGLFNAQDLAKRFVTSTAATKSAPPGEPALVKTSNHTDFNSYRLATCALSDNHGGSRDAVALSLSVELGFSKQLEGLGLFNSHDLAKHFVTSAFVSKSAPAGDPALVKPSSHLDLNSHHLATSAWSDNHQLPSLDLTQDFTLQIQASNRFFASQYAVANSIDAVSSDNVSPCSQAGPIKASEPPAMSCSLQASVTSISEGNSENIKDVFSHILANRVISDRVQAPAGDPAKVSPSSQLDSDHFSQCGPLPPPDLNSHYLANRVLAPTQSLCDNHQQAPAGDPALGSPSSQLDGMPKATDTSTPTEDSGCHYSYHPTQCGPLPLAPDFTSHSIANSAFISPELKMCTCPELKMCTCPESKMCTDVHKYGTETDPAVPHTSTGVTSWADVCDTPTDTESNGHSSSTHANSPGDPHDSAPVALTHNQQQIISIAGEIANDEATAVLEALQPSEEQALQASKSVKKQHSPWFFPTDAHAAQCGASEPCIAEEESVISHGGHGHSNHCAHYSLQFNTLADEAGAHPDITFLLKVLLHISQQQTTLALQAKKILEELCGIPVHEVVPRIQSMEHVLAPLLVSAQQAGMLQTCN